MKPTTTTQTKFVSFVQLALRLCLPMFAAPVFLMGCAVLHHAQIGQIDNRNGATAIPFEVKVSEMGVNTQGIAAAAHATKSKGGDAVAGVAAIVSLFQLGPRTGNPVYDSKYAEKVIYLIHEKCPTGRVTGLTSIREMRDYPAISGEIVKITGYCLKDRVPASADSGLAPIEGEL